MRKRDRIFIAPLLAVGLLFAAAPTALAAESGEQFVFDKADLLTTEEEDELNDMANNLSRYRDHHRCEHTRPCRTLTHRRAEGNQRQCGVICGETLDACEQRLNEVLSKLNIEFIS